jgi:hypothetical protein
VSSERLAREGGFAGCQGFAPPGMKMELHANILLSFGSLEPFFGTLLGKRTGIGSHARDGSGSKHTRQKWSSNGVSISASAAAASPRTC